MTVHLNSLWGFLLWGLQRSKQRLSGPPWYTTWNWRAAKESVAPLTRLEPRVLASGHGIPMTGAGVARELRTFADHAKRSVIGNGSRWFAAYDQVEKNRPAKNALLEEEHDRKSLLLFRML